MTPSKAIAGIAAALTLDEALVGMIRESLMRIQTKNDMDKWLIIYHG